MILPKQIVVPYSDDPKKVVDYINRALFGVYNCLLSTQGDFDEDTLTIEGVFFLRGTASPTKNFTPGWTVSRFNVGWYKLAITDTVAKSLGKSNLKSFKLGLLEATTAGATVQYAAMTSNLDMIDILIYGPAGATFDPPAGANEAISFELRLRRNG